MKINYLPFALLASIAAAAQNYLTVKTEDNNVQRLSFVLVLVAGQLVLGYEPNNSAVEVEENEDGLVTTDGLWLQFYDGYLSFGSEESRKKLFDANGKLNRKTFACTENDQVFYVASSNLDGMTCHSVEVSFEGEWKNMAEDKNNDDGFSSAIEESSKTTVSDSTSVSTASRSILTGVTRDTTSTMDEAARNTTSNLTGVTRNTTSTMDPGFRNSTSNMSGVTQWNVTTTVPTTTTSTICTECEESITTVHTTVTDYTTYCPEETTITYTVCEVVCEESFVTVTSATTLTITGTVVLEQTSTIMSSVTPATIAPGQSSELDETLTSSITRIISDFSSDNAAYQISLGGAWLIFVALLI